jgi:hypothetical protein
MVFIFGSPIEIGFENGFGGNPVWHKKANITIVFFVIPTFSVGIASIGV